MVYQATVDGVINRCVSYVGVNVNIIGNNNITLTSNLLGYSNVGACISCLSISPTPTPTLSITPTMTVTRTSNQVTPTQTATPTKTIPIYYYLWRNCLNDRYICWPGVPFGSTSDWSIGKAFKTTNNDTLYPSTCWALETISTSCSNPTIPSYLITTYISNPFTSLINTVLPGCSSCTTSAPATGGGTGGQTGTSTGINTQGDTGGSTGAETGTGGTTQSCVCTAVRTVSGFPGVAFYTDCNGNPAQISVPGGAGIAGSACFCRQSNTSVTGAVVVEACQSSATQGQSTLNNICGSIVQCS